MPKPRFNPGFAPLYITNVGGEPRVKPGVWRLEMRALDPKSTAIRNKLHYGFPQVPELQKLNQLI
jgi:hypothetical protein